MPKHRKLTRISLTAATARVRRAEARYVNKETFVDIGIEEHIRPVVIALVAHGFPTQNSCGGHLESNLYPWVRFEPAFTGEIDRVLSEQHRKNPSRGVSLKRFRPAILAHVKRIHYEVGQLTTLLGSFWSRHSLTGDRELRATPQWDPLAKSDDQVVDEYIAVRAKRLVAPPGYWLECNGAEALRMLPCELLDPVRQKILDQRREDMRTFGEFLASKL